MDTKTHRVALLLINIRASRRRSGDNKTKKIQIFNKISLTLTKIENRYIEHTEVMYNILDN